MAGYEFGFLVRLGDKSLTPRTLSPTLPFQGTQFVANVAWTPVLAGVLVDFLLLHRQKQPLRLPVSRF